MANKELNIVTGAFGYTGRHITRRLLAAGKDVKTLTGHPDRPNEFGDKVAVAPLDFSDPAKLTRSLEGASTLFNTYWIRFSHDGMTFDKAVENSKTLIKAASDAGIRRIVHISITNPSASSPLPYYSGKAEVEKAIMESNLSYAILRPNVIFGDEGILINNIAWMLRSFLFFAVPGSGDYKLQPMYTDDLADLAAGLAEKADTTTIDAVGPEIYSFNDLLKLIAEKIGAGTKIIHLNPTIALYLSRIVGWFLRDVVLTSDEVDGLHANLLVSDQTPTGKTKLSDWLTENSSWLGKAYMSELKKHYR